jgi:MbtH protein
MNNSDADDLISYLVVINHEEQYSIWPTNQPLPSGWKMTGQNGTRQECLATIGRFWTNMLPLSLRHKDDQSAYVPTTP